MALRSLSRTAHVSSGPGRGPASDGRTRHRHTVRRRARRRQLAGELTRVRAEALFAPPPSYAARPAPEQEPEPPPPPAPDHEPTHTWRQQAVLAVRDRLPLWAQRRIGIERRGALALVVVLGVVALFAVQHFWAGRTQSVRAPETVRAAVPSPVEERSGAADAPAGPGPAMSSGAAMVVVDVGGKVRRPGVRRLPAGARVADALRAAGGVRPGADTSGLNRARLLTDGEQVLVGAPAAPVAGAPGAPGGPSGLSGSGGSSGPGSAGAGEAAGSAPAGPIGLNTATLEQLDTLPGVGPVLAQHILDYRTEHGGFRSVDELREVNGIGDRRFEDLHDLVRP
ncbi:ComEA family DNA-binding protein [Streptomyces sp. NPDC046939]|uniref:ComEA family DNA-binding protein n=1 Tax=Streptomyces sp. NPDC046939 TaxID=3155376 RepID=UPI003404D603